MKKFTKGLVLLLVLVLSASVFAACGKDNGNSGKQKEAAGQIIVGTTTDPTGDIVPYWTNGSTDYAAYQLTTGAETVSMTKESTFIYNDSALKEHKEAENADGSKTWTFTLNDNLQWSNGEKITAKDYVFSILFWSCDEVAVDLGADEAYLGYYFKGYGDFSTGKNDWFSGIGLIDDSTFTITVDKENLPYYFETSLVSVAPTYMKGWVPSDVDIQYDEAKGCRFTENFTAEHIKDTVDNYRYNQTAFSGAYVISNYDSGALSYTLTSNDKFVGDYNKQKANIKTIILKKVEQETMMDELKTGSVDLLPEVTDGDLVVEGMDMVESGDFQASTYARNGYGYISFVCDNGPSQFQEVRQAVAYLLDRNEFAKTFTKGYGTVVNGAYGTAMHEYEYNKDTLAKLNAYNYSLESAVKALEDGGWTLDANGNAYSGSGVRYKEVTDAEIGKSENEVVNVNGKKLMKLSLNWASSDGNSVSDLIATMLVQNPDLATAGIEIKQTVMTFAEMYTNHYQNQDETYYNMYNLATNYTSVFDVKNNYAIDSTANQNHINDEKLATLAADMLKVNPTDEKTYMSKFVEFQQRYNELLPTLPLYSNTYADFYNKNLKGYDGVTALWSWVTQILYASMGN